MDKNYKITTSGGTTLGYVKLNEETNIYDIMSIEGGTILSIDENIPMNLNEYQIFRTNNKEIIIGSIHMVKSNTIHTASGTVKTDNTKFFIYPVINTSTEQHEGVLFISKEFSLMNVRTKTPQSSRYNTNMGGARRNKKRTRRHKNKKKRDKRTRSRKTRNNRRKH